MLRSGDGSSRLSIHRFGVLALFGAWVLFSGCDGGGVTPPDSLRYGQVGAIRIDLEVPLQFGAGALHQSLRWTSEGDWELRERISYRDLPGDETLTRSDGDPSFLAGDYATLITLLNDAGTGLELFIDDLSPDSVWACEAERPTTISVTLVDAQRNDSTTWTRCTQGSLVNLTPVGAGPDAAASRVVAAAELVRDATVGPEFQPAYLGSLPFGTLDRGGDTPAPHSRPLYLLDEESWSAFWRSHAPGRPLPAVDFATEMVIVAIAGERSEAGDSVEVRRVLQVDEGTLAEVVERQPGDFCSPAALRHTPFHIVVAPRAPAPLTFADIVLERVSCGG